MRTDKLIETLAADPVTDSPRLALRLLVGLVTAAVMFFALWGVRGGYIDAMSNPSVAAKQVVPLAAALILLWPLSRIGRPDRAPLWPLILPVLIFAAVFFHAMPDRDFLGHSALFCLMSVLLLALPIGITLFGALARITVFAPKRAGLIAGLTAGTFAATGYAFFCDEDSASFYAIWYTLGIVLSGLAGRWAGARFLGV